MFKSIEFASYGNESITYKDFGLMKIEFVCCLSKEWYQQFQSHLKGLTNNIYIQLLLFVVVMFYTLP